MCRRKGRRTLAANAVNGAVRDTGIDPRVPQKRSFMVLFHSHGSDRVRYRRKYRKHQVEMAHLEDFGNDGSEGGYGDPAVLRLDLLGRQQQDAQSHTADVHHIGKIQYQRTALHSALPQMLTQRILESPGVRVVKPPTHGEDPDYPLLSR